MTSGELRDAELLSEETICLKVQLEMVQVQVVRAAGDLNRNLLKPIMFPLKDV